jgi:Winged helix DNA-binding domain
LWLRARAQRLISPVPPASEPVAILRDVCGLQAQVVNAAALGLRARSRGLRMRDVTTALNEERSIVRTWLMRGTLHIVAGDDLGWMLSVLGPVFAAGNQARHAQLGLDPDTKSKGAAAIRRILSEAGPLTRYEIVDRLRRSGVRLDPKTQAPIHLIAYAGLHGVLCLGPERDNGEPTYVLIQDWIGKTTALPRERALGELARRYFAAYGPATLEDLVTWSGLPVPLARSAMSDARTSLVEISFSGSQAFLPRGRLRSWRQVAARRPSVRLLPAFDTYLLGYRDRDLAVPAALQKRLQRGGGWLHPAVVVDGRAVAAWSLRRIRSRGEILVEPMQAVRAGVRAGIEAECDDIGRFLDLPISWGTGRRAGSP